MGLDMYLYKRPKGMGGLPEDETSEPLYWRKANQIRQWFVDHTGYDKDADTVIHPVTKDHLEDLVKDCTTVLFHPEMAEKVLPTSDGFYFGNSEYNSGYFAILRQTVCGIMELLVSIDWDAEEVVYYEWW